jgi:PST family polysaccharide transporter
MAENAFRGALWTSGGRVVTQFVGVVFGVVLARMLGPDDFGMVGMITVFTGFATLFGDLGLGAAMVHSQDTTEVQWSSVFWVNIGVGLLLTAIVAGLAPVVAAFFDKPALVPVTLALSAGFAIASFGIVPSTLLKKELRFKRLVRAEAGALVIAGATGIALAVAGAGVWSLVGQSLAATIARAALLWREARWKPMFRCRWEHIRELAGFSSNALGFSAVNYWLRNGDNLLVGKYLGASALGVYARCYSLMLLPLSNVSRSLADVLFPTFSRIQDDRPRVASAYLRGTQAVAAITVPMMTGLCILSDPFVRAVYGQAWLPMIPILRVLCPVGAVQSIVTLNGTLYLSQGRSGRQLVVGTIVGVMGLGAIALGLRHGLIGVAGYYAIFSLVVFLPSIQFAVSVVGLSALGVMRNLRNVMICSAVMALVVLGVDRYGLAHANPWVRLGVGTTIGVAVQIGMLRFLRVPALDDVRNLLRRIMPAAGTGGRASFPES